MDDGSVIILEEEFVNKEDGKFSDWLDSHDFLVRTRKEKLKGHFDSLTPNEIDLELRKEAIKTIVAEVIATVEVTS